MDENWGYPYFRKPPYVGRKAKEDEPSRPAAACGKGSPARHGAYAACHLMNWLIPISWILECFISIDLCYHYIPIRFAWWDPVISPHPYHLALSLSSLSSCLGRPKLICLSSGPRAGLCREGQREPGAPRGEVRSVCWKRYRESMDEHWLPNSW